MPMLPQGEFLLERKPRRALIPSKKEVESAQKSDTLRRRHWSGRRQNHIARTSLERQSEAEPGILFRLSDLSTALVPGGKYGTRS